MVQHIRCAECRFARPDRKASDRNWTAYESGNRDSEYYRSLLNITPSGEKLTWITWKGCVWGEPVKRGDA